MTDEFQLTRIDILMKQITACQQEIASYNNTFISSVVICSILTASAAFVGKISTEPYLLLGLYAIPLLYLMVLYNLMKYTGFQISLGAYRKVLEDKLNELVGEPRLLLWENGYMSSREVFFWLDGVGQIVFYIPPLFLFGFLIFSIPVKGFMWFFFLTIYIMEILLCLFQGINLILKTNKESQRFEDLSKPKIKIFLKHLICSLYERR